MHFLENDPNKSVKILLFNIACKKIDQETAAFQTFFILYNIENCVMCVENVKQFKILYKKKTSQMQSMQFIPQRVFKYMYYYYIFS